MLDYFAQGKGGEEVRYTQEDFLFRWRKLERIVEKQGTDGLLLVTGLDGGDHPSSSLLFNWLFLGLSGQAVLANRYLDPIYSEMVVVVGSKGSAIFLTPEAMKKFSHLVHTLPNCTVFTPTAQQYQQKDELDILKVSFFHQSTRHLNKIGVFLGQNDDAKSIEKWSLIQSFALEPVGGTFFTLQHPCLNLHAKVTALFKNMDRHSLKNMVAQTAYAMEGHIRGTTQLIQYTPLPKRPQITQLKLQQPLFEATDIVGQGEGGQGIVRVLFGKRTELNQPSGEHNINDTAAFHFTLQHYDPTTRLQVWRTYFLDLNPERDAGVTLSQEQDTDTFLTKAKYEVTFKQNSAFLDRRALIGAYLGLVQATLDSIATVSKDYRNLHTKFLHQHIHSKLNTILGEKQQVDPNRVEVWLQSYDSMGQPRPIDFKDSITFKLTSTFYVIKCKLRGVKSSKGHPLGSVIFSECFLLQEGCYLLLTNNTPYFDFWRTSADPNELLQQLNPNIEFPSLGESVSEEFKGRLFIPVEGLPSWLHLSIPLLNVSYHFHKGGIRLYHDKIGWHLLSYADIQQATMASKVPGQWVLLKMAKPLLFAGLEATVFALEFRGKAFEALLQKVNTKDDPLQLGFIEQVPPILGESWCFAKEILQKQVKQGALMHQHQIISHDFLWSFIEAKQLMVLNQMKDIKLAAFKNLYAQSTAKKVEQAPQPEKDKTQLIIICGTYGAGKSKLAQTLSRFGDRKRRYQIFHISHEHLHSKMQLETYLNMLEEFIEDNKQEKDLFLVVLPAWLLPTQALPALAAKYHIRTVVSKISCSNFYASPNQALTQNVLTFALPGHAQAIVLDTRGEKQAQISTIEHILWHFNKETRVNRASNSMLSTGQVNDILKGNLYESEYHRFLRSKYGAFYKFDALAQIQVNFLEFKYPVVDVSPLSALTETQGYLLDQAALKQELRPKREEAQKSKDQLMQGLYRLEQAMTRIRKREKLPQIRCLKGCLLSEQSGQPNEIIWANADFRQREVSGKKTLGLFIMSRRFDQFQVKEFLLSLTKRKLMLQGLRAPRTVASLTEDERTKIGVEGRDRYLDGGQFFDGYFYRDVEGFILPGHPHLDRLLQEWVDQQNKQIQQYNKGLRSQWDAYCKEWE